MKKITNTNSQFIHLEGFGAILVEEQRDGVWHVDLFPRGWENDVTKIQLENTFTSFGDKNFAFVLPQPKKDS